MNRVAVITGGARGIGLGIARSLAAEGLDLVLNGVRPESDVADVVADLARTGRRVAYISGDIGVPADRERLIAEAISRMGRIDVLVNNAGITSPGRKDILEATEEAFDRVMAVNLKGAFFLTQLAARQMIRQREQVPGLRGYVINVSSISADFVSVNRGDYCLSKSALAMSTRLWAARLAEYDIDVFEIRPGVIRSDMTAGVVEKYDKLLSEGLTLDRRWGEAEDVGRAAAMLVRGDLPYATGQVLRIDGGMTINRL
ncbi:3-ketoacyl-ACP reductase [Planctomyces sp. SH-PL14]|uniref:3-ketoacyl-ACP reductase n=1 Tax=Planctomyces sp. SH-PL14 TaxID=1632864 RepID=UPI00078BE58B|nr:3-ketoacyl-ACP reductase [Planctomyces sp. SH-PL14]AMV19884.1 2-dehydro-3-deoxy-D-gluconate 5-dehydrogenase [Planctomyces sp. SH-PL14]